MLIAHPLLFSSSLAAHGQCTSLVLDINAKPTTGDGAVQQKESDLTYEWNYTDRSEFFFISRESPRMIFVLLSLSLGLGKGRRGTTSMRVLQRRQRRSCIINENLLHQPTFEPPPSFFLTAINTYEPRIRTNERMALALSY